MKNMILKQTHFFSSFLSVEIIYSTRGKIGLAIKVYISIELLLSCYLVIWPCNQSIHFNGICTLLEQFFYFLFFYVLVFILHLSLNWLLNYLLSIDFDEKKVSRKVSYHPFYEITTTIVG